MTDLAHEPTDPPTDDATAYAVLRLDGPDAAPFLQGQSTQNLLTWASGETALTAVLTPQGRVLALPHVRRVTDGLRLLLPADLVEPLRAHLSRYVLRAKVRLRSDVPSPDDLSALADVGTPSARVRAGLAEISAVTSGEWIPQMLNLDLIGAISFTKGCYTGQEIVARTQHLGRIKRRMLRYTLDGNVPLRLEPLYHAGSKIGEVVIGARTEDCTECLAVINLDARDLPLTLTDGRVCRPAPLPYPVP